MWPKLFCSQFPKQNLSKKLTFIFLSIISFLQSHNFNTLLCQKKMSLKHVQRGNGKITSLLQLKIERKLVYKARIFDRFSSVLNLI